MANIEIPEQVIKAEIDWRDTSGDEIAVVVEVAGVPVMRRTYSTDRPYPYPPDYAYNMEDAKEKALAEFGKKIQALIGEEKE